MGSVYDRAEIYDIIENESRDEAFRAHWKKIFENRNIQTMLDVSIGSGSTTIPASDLGIRLCGSDLSEEMLGRCAKKMEKRNLTAELKQSDFRDLSCWGERRFDLVASTGNSLAYVKNEEILKALEEMDKHVKDGGWLYYDLRNWDKILKQRQRFYLYNPFFKDDVRINLMQVWDYHEDNSMTFNLLYTFERENKIQQKEEFQEHYFPVGRELLLNKLREMGYEEVIPRGYPAQYDCDDFDKIDWYYVIARKKSESI